MFKNIKLTRHLGYDSNSKLFNYEFKIIDDDFEWIGAGEGASVSAGADAIIKCYSEKKLPIVQNVVQALIFYNQKYGWNIKLQIECNKKFCPNWNLIEKDIDKYLSLI